MVFFPELYILYILNTENLVWRPQFLQEYHKKYNINTLDLCKKLTLKY
jgi:hypothetical protein